MRKRGREIGREGERRGMERKGRWAREEERERRGGKATLGKVRETMGKREGMRSEVMGRYGKGRERHAGDGKREGKKSNGK